jgi:hypothetical protein
MCRKNINNLRGKRMFIKTVATIARLFLLLIPVAATAASCGDSGKGSSGSAGTGGGAGTTGTAGATGTAGTSGGKDCTVGAATSADATILDFETATAGASQVAFGGYMPGTYGGGTFIYPDKGLEADLMGLTNTFDGMNWHITGLVKKYAGFGLYLTSKSDVSMFGGIQFDIKGTLTPTGAGDGGAAPSSVTMTVLDARHEVDSAHTADGRMTCGTCTPVTEYDGTCAAPSKAIPLTGTTVTQIVRWTELTGGRRPPSFSGESPDPAQITAISWVLPWNGDGSAQYMVDITVDNLKYVAP